MGTNVSFSTGQEKNEISSGNEKIKMHQVVRRHQCFQ